MNIILTNTSRYPTHIVRWLTMFAARYVRDEARRIGFLEKFDAYPISVRVTNTQHAFCGMYMGLEYARRNSRLAHIQHHTVRNVLVRVGSEKRFPCDSTYPGYKDMPQARLNDWQEAVVGVTAHELAHTKYGYQTGDRKGDEVACECIEQDCVEAFRKVRAIEFDGYCQRIVAVEQQKQQAIAAKQAPQVVLERQLRKSQDTLANWVRKQKLAATKVKKYTRESARIAKRLAALAPAQQKGGAS